MEILKTDVLVIGGGGAGLRAALSAREEGAEVLLVSKTPIGKSTCTQLSAGAFCVASQGFSGAFLPLNMLQKRLPRNMSCAAPVMNAAIEMK